MYYIVESPKVLNWEINDVSHVKLLKSNRDNMLMCGITGNEIMIWLTTSSNLIAFYQRADNSVQIHGENHIVEWKNDSSKIVVLTTKGYLIYYMISYENDFVLTDISYAQTAWNDSSFLNNSSYQNPLLSCKIIHEFSIHIQNCQKTLCCFGNEIYVPLTNGKVIRVPWSDRTRVDHFFFQLQSIYFQFKADGEQFKLKENVHILEFEIINSDDGCICIAASLSDGSAIYISTDQTTNVFRGLISKNPEKNLSHKCVTINPLYKLLVYGCKNGVVVAYNQPDNSSSLSVSHKYVTANIRNHEHHNVSSLKWLPDYRALCVLYDNGEFCLFSVFGSLLYDSKDLLSFQLNNSIFNISKALEFGVEGFSLWTYLQTNDNSIQGNLVKLKLLKSSLINNCYMSNIEHIALNGDREIYACLNLNRCDLYSSTQTNNKIAPKYHYPSLKLGGNSMWQVLNIPLTYISSNFPVKMSAIDSDGKYLAVAGRNGFTHYSFLTRKWKIFGNADQEREIQITGGLLWWKDFICISCFNLNDQKDELRFYSRNTNLDNTYSKKSRTTCTILQMNTFKNLLIMFGIDCRVQVIGLEGGKDSNASKIILNRLVEIQIENYVQRNPYLVVSVALCPLTCGINQNDLVRTNIESSSSTLKSILINTSGKLLMFQPEPDRVLSIPEDLKKTKPYTSLPPVQISDSVENCWVIPNNQSIKLLNSLMNFTLWLNSGSKGVKLWLPLSGEENELQQSNRVFLDLPVNFYPLSILINEALFIGVSTELTLINQDLAYSQLQKETQLFVPYILEGLIRKKFFIDAKKIAICYRYLPYFLHALELLVHKVLEEEANSPPDAPKNMLQDVINFIEQFPEYLKIISHCTRKSEVAVWPYLFSIVGESCKLYEKCLSLNDLETAASYLVVLQNTEKLKLCQKFANMLLRSSLKSCEWDLVKEIIRFLSAIDPDDLEDDIFDVSQEIKTTDSPEKSIKNSPKSPASSNSTTDESRPKQKISKTRSYSSYDYQITIQSIQNTVYDHAYFLLTNYRLKQLFGMFANLNGFNIKKWLHQYQRTKLVNNYVLALSGLHFDFNWPYPIMINHKKTNSFVSIENENKNISKIMNEKKDDFNDKGDSSKSDRLPEPDVNLIAQELANNGSPQSEKQLSYIMNVFISVNCYEWVFLLSLVLKRMAIVNEIMRQLIAGELQDEIVASLQKGIPELDLWSQDECCGYRAVIKKISEYC